MPASSLSEAVEVALRRAIDARSMTLEGWGYAPLATLSRTLGGFLVDVEHCRVIELALGDTLLANEKRLRMHEYTGRWFEASAFAVRIEEVGAFIADARASNGARVQGIPLPLSKWTGQRDPEEAITEPAEGRMAALTFNWQPLAHGDAIECVYPKAHWMFLRCDRLVNKTT